MTIEKAYEFDDVLIKPLPSTVCSRDEVDISVNLLDKLTLKFPLIASPMVGVVNGEFAKKLSDLGGLAVLHRFYKNREELFEDIRKNLSHEDKFGIAIKIGEENFEEYFDSAPNIILVDTANGYNKNLLDYCNKIKNYITKNGYNDVLLMAGNVATGDGCKKLYESGCDLIRVGIGNGSICSTRNQTGIGIPSVTSLRECVVQGLLDNENYMLVLDGGIKNSGDFVKAIVAGADLGMSGKLFAQSYEAPNKGVLYGMASRTHMKNTKTDIKSVEGIDIQIEKKYSLEQFVSEFGYGIKSAGTYLNAKNLEQIFFNGQFIEVSSHAIKNI